MTGGLKNLVVSIDISSPRLVMATDSGNSVSVEETYCFGVKKGKITDVRLLSNSVRELLEKVLDGARIKVLCAGLAVTNVSLSEEFVIPGQLNEQLIRVFKGLGIKPGLILPTIQASARIVLSEVEKQLGVVLVEIGDSSTSVAIFNYGHLQKAMVFPVGESHIKADLAVGLGISLEEAEKVKNGGVTELSPTGLQHRVKFIIESRLEEIFSIVKKQLFFFLDDWQPPGGVVLTGAGAGLPDIVHFARNIISLSARVGVTAVPGVPDCPAYAAALGVLQMHRDTYRTSPAGVKYKVYKNL